jgi:hypothetical protein
MRRGSIDTLEMAIGSKDTEKRSVTERRTFILGKLDVHLLDYATRPSADIKTGDPAGQPISRQGKVK